MFDSQAQKRPPAPPRNPIDLWALQLYREYDSVLFQFRLPIRKALIVIDDLGNQWGTWNPVTCTITISQRLIEQHSWDVVVEVLKHETAHQLASELFKPSKPHGPEFAQACKMLGLRGWAAQASGEIPREIPHWRDRVLSEEEERMMRKVEKLLSLATSSNEHEALLAMQRVREIYAKYNLDRLQGGDRSQHEYLIVNRKRKKMDAAESTIYSILVEHFFVKVIFASTYDAKDLCTYRTAEIFGTKENILMAEYVFHFLLSRTQVMWLAYQSSKGRTLPRMKNSYILGLLSGFRTKLRGENPTTAAAQSAGLSDSQINSLIATGAHDLDAFLATRFPRLSSRSRGSSYVDRNSFASGQSDGKKITLHKGISHSTGNQGRLLT